MRRRPTHGRASPVTAHADLTTRWQTEAAAVGWSADLLAAAIDEAATEAPPPGVVTVSEVIEAVSQERSSWSRADVLQAICDRQRPVSQPSGDGWAETLERATDRVLGKLIDLDPPGETARRESDGRSVWIEPTAPRFTSDAVLVQEEAILTWAMAAQADPPAPSTTVDRDGLDVLQGDAGAALAGDDRLVLMIGPAGAGKTRTLITAAQDLHAHGRVVFAVAPTAKAARTLERDTGIPADTVAKLLHEWHRGDRSPLPEFRLPAGATLVVDEAGMLTTPALHGIVTLAERNRWRLALVGDPRQLQGVGRGGLLAELCVNGRVEELERLHRFTHRWEAAASLQLRAGDPRAFDAYQAHGRIVAGTLVDHLHRIAEGWIDAHQQGRTLAVVASTNDHVDLINRAVQFARFNVGHLDRQDGVRLAAGEVAVVGDVVATRRNDRRLTTRSGEPVRNRDTWTVTAIDVDGSITVSHRAGHGDVRLPADYVREHVRLGYAATEHGWQSDTVDAAIALVSPATSRRGLYVAATRGRDDNEICVVTDSRDVAEARDILEAIVAVDRADIPATTQRRTLAQSVARADTPAPPEPTPRCEIPDWFPTVLDDARRALHDAEARDAEQAARRAQATAVAATVDEVLADVAAATAVDRDALRHAETRAAAARRHHDAAHYRYDTAPRRHRRGPRRDLDVAEQQLDRAEHYLERTRQRTAPAVERHARALAEQRHAHEQLRNCDTTELLDSMTPSVGDHRLHVHALTTWHRWAQGHHVPDRAIHLTHNVLAHQPGTEQHLATALRDQLPTPTNTGLRHAHAEVDTRARIVEPDLGIDL